MPVQGLMENMSTLGTQNVSQLCPELAATLSCLS